VGVHDVRAVPPERAADRRPRRGSIRQTGGKPETTTKTRFARTHDLEASDVDVLSAKTLF
jgi:hypothetical protein